MKVTKNGKTLAVGKHQCKMLDFAYRNPGWHTPADDWQTFSTLHKLEKRGGMEINESGQFRFKQEMR